MKMDPATHFIGELGFSHEVVEGLARGWGWIVPELCVPGTEFPHIAVMLTLSDSVTGVLASAATAPQGMEGRLVAYVTAQCRALE